MFIQKNKQAFIKVYKNLKCFFHYSDLGTRDEKLSLCPELSLGVVLYNYQ